MGRWGVDVILGEKVTENADLNAALIPLVARTTTERERGNREMMRN